MRIESPCIRNCCLDNDDICLGCFRHIDEIVGWQALPDADKQNIITLCRQRKAKHHEASLFPPSE
ncbi:DUF1289 domain-containing protein [Thalassotalea sp. M1531]|uniref:DUF1289 domain-containing protein n=1 Tax=Thalassotalea algicola TaxID=2716224 RepID=A0A7Y0LA76_9GAMM|nr:DUF1289 domain-containing protein [Thalassotalea algicola]NMP30509.1 DUF1289 domain-containing protein [Thalassotalea algicola]